MLPRLRRSIWKDSWSQSWGHLQLWSGTLATSFYALGEVLNDNSVKNAVDALHLDPRLMFSLAVLGAITLIARSHKDA